MSIVTNGVDDSFGFNAIIMDFLGENSKEQTPKVLDTCNICYCDMEDSVNYCDEKHKGTCRDCIKQFITVQLNDAFAGSCPILWCHTCKETKVNRILKFSNWKNENNLKNECKKYMELASSVIYMKCRGCHTNRDLLVNFSKYKDITFGEEYLEDLNKYETNEYSIDEFYKKIIEDYLRNIDTKICDKSKIHRYTKNYGDELSVYFHFLLSTIDNPERRMNLQLRFYRDYPKILTLCCNRDHCFKCKTQYHNGKTCLQFELSTNKNNVQDNDIVECPRCNLSLVKGDGCESIHCVCGKEFNWQYEKIQIANIKLFLEQYNKHTNNDTQCSTHDYCVNLAWNENNKYALSWLNRYVESQTILKTKLVQMFGFYTVHIFVNAFLNYYLNIEKDKRDIFVISRGIIENTFKVSYETLRKSYKNITHYILTDRVYQNDYDRNIDILKQLNVCDKIASDAINMIALNKKMYIPIKNKKIFNAFARFNYTDINQKVYMGNFCKIKKTNNKKITFVQKKAMHFSLEMYKPFQIYVKNISNDFFIGLGRDNSLNTTGLYFSSSRIYLYHEMHVLNNSTDMTSTAYEYPKEAIFSMILTGTVENPRLQITMNHGEIVFTFNIFDYDDLSDIRWLIQGSVESVTFLNNPSSIWDNYRFETWQIVVEHMQLVIKQINNGEYINNPYQNFYDLSVNSKYSLKSDEFVMNITTAMAVIDLIEDFFNLIEFASEEIKNMNWKDVFYTIQWYAQYKNLINNETDEDMSTRFLMNNMDDPAFSAILIIHGMRTGSDDEIKCAKAYVRCNPEFVDFAYQNDAENKDPIIVGLKKGCMCLPRCNKKSDCSTCSNLTHNKNVKKSDEESDEESEIDEGNNQSVNNINNESDESEIDEEMPPLESIL